MFVFGKAVYCLSSLLLLSRAPSYHCVAADATNESVGQFTVKLHRQRVPVRTASETVSYKSVYSGTIFIGAPKQEFSVVFDTGSGHVVVPSEQCRDKTCRIHRRYDRKSSLHAVDIDSDGTIVLPGTPRDQLTVAYGTGEITGQFISDNLCLSEPSPSSDLALDSASDQDTSLASASQAPMVKEDCLALRIVMATEMTHDPFHSFSFDGVLGLGLEGLALAPEFSFFGQLFAQGRIAESAFGVFLADGDDEQSEICFGGHSPERLQSEIAWSPVALPELGYWQVKINNIRVGNRSFDFCDDGQCRAVVDTGTSLLTVPQALADDLEEELSLHLRNPPRGSDAQGINCRLAQGAPLHFDIDGITVTLDAGDYSRHEENDSEETPLGNNGAAETTCKPSMLAVDMPAPIGPKLFIWGEPVLRKYYTLYDLAQKRIGFGLAAHKQEQVNEVIATSKPLLPPLLL